MEVKFSVPQIMCHLEMVDPSGSDLVTVYRILPSVPSEGQQVVVYVENNVYLAQVRRVIWHFAEGDTGTDYVVVKLKQVK